MTLFYLKLYAFLLATTCAFLTGAQNINTQFNVASGTGPVTRSGTNGGSCTTRSKTSDLNTMWLETIDMATETIIRLGNYGTDQVIRASLDTYFGIRKDPASNTVLAADQGLFDTVLAFYQDVITFSTTEAVGNQPSLFCDDSWRWLTERAYQIGTGTDLKMTISTQTHGWVKEALWCPIFKQYTAATALGCGVPRVLAYTTPAPMQSITLCPFMFDLANSASRASLSPYRSPNETPQKALQNFGSQPSTMLHEICHLRRPATSASHCIDDTLQGTKVYGPKLCVQLARLSSTRAVNNADNYRWFAVAMYLPAYDWSRGIGGVKPVVPGSSKRETLLEVRGSNVRPRSIRERNQTSVENEIDDEDEMIGGFAHEHEHLHDEVVIEKYMSEYDIDVEPYEFNCGHEH